MLRLYNCIAYEHNLLLVGLAAVICITASLACSFMLARARRTHSTLRLMWVVAIALVTSAGVWSTHFIAMLAYEPGLEFSFDLLWTIRSLLISLFFNLIAIALILKTRTVLHMLGAGLLATGVIAMHYSGMQGLLPNGVKIWDQNYIAASIIFCLIFASLFSYSHHKTRKVKGRLLTGLVLVVAICAMHFLGMSALTLAPFETAHTYKLGLSANVLGLLVAIFAFIVIQGGIAAVVLDGRLSRVRKRGEEQLRKSEERLALAINGSSDGIWDWDIAEGHGYYSPRFKEMLGYQDNEFSNTRNAFRETVHPNHREKVRYALKSHLEYDTPYDVEVELKCAGGKYRWFCIRGKSIRDENGTPIRMAGGLIDINDLVAARLRAQLAWEQADRANKLKSEFLANMSHEIRTPLNGVLGMAQLLERTPLNEKQQRYASTIRSSGVALLSLINDVLDISKIEAGLMKLEPEVFDICTILQQAEDAVAGIAAQKNLTISQEINIPCSQMYYGDGKRIRQVLINLAGNAVKFTDEGGITICATEEENGRVVFSVRDTGPGIAKDQQEAIFGRFTQADASATRKHGGTGLGLAISKDIIELMDGQIGIESDLGEGATFWFSLPLPRADDAVDTNIETLKQQAAETELTTGENEMNVSLKVLVAEDNAVNQEMVLDTLELVDGVETTIVDNGAEALKALDEQTFDLVLMDINMPVMTGDEAICEIRNSSKPHANIPIIVLTANALSSQKQEYMSIGATGYLTKPLDIDELCSIVSSYLDRKKDAAA